LDSTLPTDNYATAAQALELALHDLLMFESIIAGETRTRASEFGSFLRSEQLTGGVIPL
jgi:hypothetical protein